MFSKKGSYVPSVDYGLTSLLTMTAYLAQFVSIENVFSINEEIQNHFSQATCICIR